MHEMTYQMVKVAIEADGTLSADERTAILAFCRSPFPKPSLPAPAPVGEQERYLRPREVAKAIGVTCRTVQRWIKAGTLESRKMVGCRRIPWSAVRGLCEGDAPPACRFPTRTSTAEYRGKDTMAVG